MKQSVVLSTALAVSVAVAEAGAGQFRRPMPEATNEAPSNPPRSELAQSFRSPFGKVQTAVYWYWLDGNISCEGVRRDLEAMKRAGIDRAYIGDISAGVSRGKVRTFSPEWERVLVTAFEVAHELGIEIGLFNSPGWSQSGGPWVKPEAAMRRFVAGVAVVEGPTNSVVLTAPRFECAPAEDMRDLFVAAYPAPPCFTDALVVKDADGSLSVRDRKPLVVELSAERPFLAQSVELEFAAGKVSGSVAVEAEQDGGWRRVCEMPFSRVNHENGVTFSPHAPVLAAFAPVAAKRFRVTVKPEGLDAARFASVSVRAAPLVSRAFEKSLAKMHETSLPMWSEYQWPDDPPEAAGTALEPGRAVILQGSPDASGSIAWDVPAGKWVVYRFAAAPTGVKNHPANPEATGYEVDKMSREHVKAHFDAYLGKILDRTPPKCRGAIRYAVLDSYEMGAQNFTDGFAGRFEESFGYDPRPYLPALFGMGVGSRGDSNRFLWDLRRFVADEVAYSYVGGLRAASGERGMKTWLECYGHWGFPGEFLQYGGQSDEVAGEFWSSGSFGSLSSLGNIENRAASSCAHTYGKRLVWSESNTCAGAPFGNSPADLKPRTDRFFAEGVNATLLHLYIHQPDERQPGINAWFGNEFNRHNTWFREMDVFTAYLKRANYMLQQGLNVADIAYFIGEDAPKMTGATDPAPPPGRQFDYINAEVLCGTAGVDASGRITLPHGTKYEVLVLPRLETMRPETLRCVRRLVNEGAFVIGPRPLRSPSLAGQPRSDEMVRSDAADLWGEVDGKDVLFRRIGRGTIAWNLPLEQALAMRGSATDCGFAADAPLVYCHRTMPNAEVYFVANQSGRRVDEKVRFRVAGRAPELWQAVTGAMHEAPEWRGDGNATEVRLGLAPYESVFVVFASPAAGRSGRAAAAETAAELKCEWTLEFESGPIRRGPAGPVAMTELVDLSKSADPSIRHYSGTVVYRTRFAAAKPAAGERAVLAFGGVREIARVRLNGREVGGMWTEPYEVEVADAMKEGENELEVEVATSWVNRLVGDAALPEGERPTWLASGGYRPDSRLRPAGLVGPLRLKRIQR
ncbi:MAG: glycoside hydrolase family 2 [Kiritimatiellae bacterium]|nr:glycoside hydrolase family 2 [Kiritimatiellia bacterium]MBQ6328841.1 glycoside hydrolase family 2 [Kiritimatiellia bacterium]